MLTNSKEMLLQAKEGKFADPSTNFIDLDSARTYVSVAAERQLPLMLSFAQSHQTYISLEEAALIGKHLAEDSPSPVVLHLDHGQDIAFIKKAIALGFKSVMIDASQETFEENIKRTREVVAYAHQYDVTVEAELGYVGDNVFETKTHNSVYTEPGDVEIFCKEIQVDSLAISIGTAHGVYAGTPHINFEQLDEIAKISPVPLVLHGGSSTGDTNLQRCAQQGISKINIYTDFLQSAYHKIQENQPKDYLELKALANQGMEDMLNHYFDVFGTKEVTIDD